MGSWGRRGAGLLFGGVLVLGVVGGALAAAGPASAHDHHAATFYVSSSLGTASHSGGSCTAATYKTIDAAITAATAGDTVQVCAGTYGTQVEIATSGITLTGTGPTTVIDPSNVSREVHTADTASTTPGTVPIVEVDPGVTDVSVRDLTVTGAGLEAAITGCAPDPVGVLFDASSGTASTLTIRTTVLSQALRGCQAGLGILVSETGSAAAPTGSANVAVANDTVTNFQKNGITCDMRGSRCTIAHDTVVGNGPTKTIAQNGVQVAFTAVATVVNDTVSDVDFTGRTAMSTDAVGILVYAAGDVSGATRVGRHHHGEGHHSPRAEGQRDGHGNHHQRADGHSGQQGDTNDPGGQGHGTASQGQGCRGDTHDQSHHRCHGQQPETLPQRPHGAATRLVHDTISTAQIGASVIASDAFVASTTVSSSLATAVGVEVLPCTFFCPGLGEAPKDTDVWVVGSTLTLSGSGATGLWVGYTTRNKATAKTGTLAKVTATSTVTLFGDSVSAPTTDVVGVGGAVFPTPPHFRTAND